ncbi:MAG: hypothetical protein Q8Q14_09375, partial [Gemmatimonadales bacterium]|nr:hypothetical protein [Gemmatimonadales bacterium]
GRQLAAEHGVEAGFLRVFRAWAEAVVDFGALKGWSDLSRGQMTALAHALAEGVDVDDIIRRIPPGGHKEGFGHVLTQAKDAHRRAKRQVELAAARAEEERILAERAAVAVAVAPVAVAVANAVAEPKAVPVETRATPPAPPRAPVPAPEPSHPDPSPRRVPRDPPSPPAVIPGGRFSVPGSLFRRPPRARSECDVERRRAEALRMLEEATPGCSASGRPTRPTS